MSPSLFHGVRLIAGAREVDTRHALRNNRLLGGAYNGGGVHDAAVAVLAAASTKLHEMFLQSPLPYFFSPIKNNLTKKQMHQFSSQEDARIHQLLQFHQDSRLCGLIGAYLCSSSVQGTPFLRSWSGARPRLPLTM